MRPLHRRSGQAVFDGVVVDVIDMPGQVVLVPNLVLLITRLPDGLRALVGFMVFGEPGFDQAPPCREISVIGRQRPDAMQVVGHHDHGVHLERARLAHAANGAAQEFNCSSRGKNRSPAFGHQREEKGAAWGECASVVHGGGIFIQLRIK